jgi:hypothetical protein
MVSQVAEHGGKDCHGDVEEMLPCMREHVGCHMSPWTAWDSCDRACGEGQGQQHRQRQIEKHPDPHGKQCPTQLLQTRGCVAACPADLNCQLGDWSAWSGCPVTCGAGQQERERKVNNTRKNGGNPCAFPLAETRACPGTKPCGFAECKWQDWSSWSRCSRTCGGGERLRRRQIAKETAMEDTALSCSPADGEQVAECFTQACRQHCRDGQWDEWSPWSPCSASCNAGWRYKTRPLAVSASACGMPAIGKDRVTEVCSVVPCPSRDCLFSSWTEWGACTSACNGVRTRSRGIFQQGQGSGSMCRGPLRLVKSCSVQPLFGGHDECSKGPSADCTLSPWTAWSGCGTSCHNYTSSRTREVEQQSSNGGLACDAALSEAEECPRKVCGEGPKPIDCKFGNWETWGACSVWCGGDRKRFRTVLHFPRHGGRVCEPAEIEQVESCEGKCQKYCNWSDWASWGGCSSRCGTGRRLRKRDLALFKKPPLPPAALQETMARYAALEDDLAQINGPPSSGELFMAFFGGCLVYVAGFHIARRWPQMRRQSSASALILRLPQDHATEVELGTIS